MFGTYLILTASWLLLVCAAAYSVGAVIITLAEKWDGDNE